MYQNPIYMCISWCSKICWFPVKICWCQQNSRDLSRGLNFFCIFLRQGITVPSFIIVGYVWRILGKKPPPLPIREQPRKSPSWIGLKGYGLQIFTLDSLFNYVSKQVYLQKRCSWNSVVICVRVCFYESLTFNFAFCFK